MQPTSISKRRLTPGISRHEELSDLLRFRGIPVVLVGLHTEIERAVKCGCVGKRGVSVFFLLNSGVKWECVFTPSLFNACMDWVQAQATVGNTQITYLDFADDAVIFAESLKVVVLTRSSAKVCRAFGTPGLLDHDNDSGI